jgi:hypothetical protein
MFRHIKFKWIPSHAERLNNISTSDWSLEQIGNDIANSVASGQCDRVKLQHPNIRHDKLQFSAIVRELKGSTTMFLAHNGVPTGVKQLESIQKDKRFLDYLEKRTLASIT